MKRWRRDSIAMTIALTIVVAMGLGFTLQHLVHVELGNLGSPPWKHRRYYDARFYVVILPTRIASLVEVLDATPDTKRLAMIAAAQRPNIRIELLDAPLPDLVNSTHRSALALRRRIEMLFVASHPLVIAPRSKNNNGQADETATGEHGMLVEAPLADGHWLLFKTKVPTPPTDAAVAAYSRAAFGAWMGLAAILVLLLSVLTARRLASPLSDLAVAAEHLGASGEAPLLRPKGPRELRMAINAFNRMQERLRRFNDDRVQMLAAMSHDLRTSLTRLKLRLELGETQEQKQKMMVELDAMGAMMGSILSFARDDTKREPRTLTDLDALVEGVCEDASDAGGAVTYAGSRGATVLARPVALRRAISNLVENAIKYGGGAEISLISEAERTVVAVEDRGPGIPRGEQEKVFDPFYRIEGSRNPDTGGVGLGLSVARSIAREHGGDIVLVPRKGGGLSARLELPA